MECSICGISDKMRNVSQVISNKGIEFVCDKCAQEEGFPRMKKVKMMEPGKPESMYQRMSRIAGVTPKREAERPLLRTQEKDLKAIVNKNYEEKLKKQDLIVKSRPDLVDNFQWIIMRVRRVKGLTQSQLAERVSEPEAAIKMAEQGVVPEGYVLIDKLERYLKVKLIKQRDLTLHVKEEKPIHVQNGQNNKQKLAFDRYSLSSWTIDDLKKMRQEKESSVESGSEKGEEGK